MSMEKVFENTKKKRLMEGRPYILKLKVCDANGNNSEIKVLVNKLRNQAIHKCYDILAKNSYEKGTKHGTGEVILTKMKTNNDIQSGNYKICTNVEKRIQRKRTNWKIQTPQLYNFSPDELVGRHIVVEKAGVKIGGTVATAKIIDTKPISRPAPPIEAR